MPDAPLRRVERQLVDLAGEIEFPRTPDIARSVGDRLRSEPPEHGTALERILGGSTRIRAIAISMVALTLAAGTAFAASPTVRNAVLELMGVRGVRVEHAPVLPPVSPDARADLGTRAAVAERHAGFDLLRVRETSLSPPDGVYVRAVQGIALVSFDFGPAPGLPASPHTETGLLFTQFRAHIDDVLLKKLLAASDATAVRIHGERGYWLAAGRHVVAYRSGGRLIDERLAGRVLLWQQGPVTLRLEGEISLNRALEIARSAR